MTSALRLNLLGAGRVGQTLAWLWHDQGLADIQDLLTRSHTSALEAATHLGQGRALGQLSEARPADLWLLAVPDAQLPIAAQRLAEAAALHSWPTSMAWHCSGFLASDVLAPLSAIGWSVASAHPAMSFAQPTTARTQFAGTPCALEGDAAATDTAARLLTAIGGRCFPLRTQDKLRYHAAAVLASNFAPVLQAAAADLWQSCGMPEPLVTALWQGFVRRVGDNLLQMGPQAALTGPASRGDLAVVDAQTAALTALDPALGQAYAALSELAGRLARSGHVLPDQT